MGGDTRRNANPQASPTLGEWKMAMQNLTSVTGKPPLDELVRIFHLASTSEMPAKLQYSNSMGQLGMTAISSAPSMQVFRTCKGCSLNLSRVSIWYIVSIFSIGFLWFPHVSALKTFKPCDQIWDDLGVRSVNPKQSTARAHLSRQSDGCYIPVADRGDRHRADPHSREHGVHVFGGFQNVEQGWEPALGPRF